MVMEVRLVQYRNALSPMLVTLLGIATSLTSLPFKYNRCAYLRGFEYNPANLILHQAAMSNTCTEVRPEHL
jgi:hypothetical protein